MLECWALSEPDAEPLLARLREQRAEMLIERDGVPP
jgi:hypothetical protein